MGNRAFSFAALSLVLAILASASMSAVAQAQRAIVVTSTANDGPGTLRQALLDAVNGDTITFDPIVFPPDSPATITLTSALPEITQGNLTIDASNAGVILDGSSIGDPDVDGLVVRSAGSVIRGLQILFFPRIGIHLTTSANNTIGGNATVGTGPSGQGNVLAGNGDAGIYIGGGHNNVIVGNRIGTDASGMAALGNNAGVLLREGTQGNQIGGTTAGERNVIAANRREGVVVMDIGTGHNVVAGNYIGTDATGSVALPNGADGVYIGSGASHNLIGRSNATPGGACMGECNVISGNGGDGVWISDSGTMSNTVSGNYIGTNISGTFVISNAGVGGVSIGNGASYNLIGGANTTPWVACSGECNLISGNGTPGAGGGSGVWLQDSGTTSNTVSGNLIGTDLYGTMALGNSFAGVSIAGGAQYNVIGGDTDGEHNVISGNNSDGVWISDNAADHNTVSGNYIGTSIDGIAVVPNGNDGVLIRNGAQYNKIGGNTSGEGNLISGNGSIGVAIVDSGTDHNTVSGNHIGTDVTGGTVLPNGGSGVTVGNGASNNLIGGSNASPGGACSGECNLISGNGSNGVSIGDHGDADHNFVSGNYIGTDVSGKAELGNSEAGVWIRNGASDNTIGPGNVVAYNGQSGIHVSADEPSGAPRNTLTQNAIYDNASQAIDISRRGTRAQLPRPQITRVGFRTILGTAPPNSTVELFSDDASDAQYYEGSTVVDEVGALTFRVPRDGFTEQYITATATDEDGTTSELSDPASAQPPVLYELPGIPTPGEVSLEPKVIRMNLSLALISVLFFGATAMVFNSTFEKHSSEMHAAVDGALPRRLGKWLRPKTLTSKGQILRNWIALLALTSLIESFLDTRPLGMARLSVFLALFLAAIATSGLDMGSDLLIRQRLAPHTQIRYQTHWIGLIIAAGCVILSRAMNFQPGYLYGIVGALTLLPELSDTTKAGKRALVVLLAVLGGGLLAWLLSPLLAPISADLEALLLTIFIISLQGVFFALLPIAVTDGGDIWYWNKWYWGLLATGILFIFYHIVLFPAFSEVELLRQNSVQTVLVLFAIFGAATLGLWLLFPFRLRRAKNE